MRVLKFMKYEGGRCECVLNSGGKCEVRMLTLSVLPEKRELTVKPPLLKP